MVVAHLCVSDAIAERAGRVLRPGGVFAFVAFHTDQWKETGRPSRFAYGEAGVRRLLRRCGFAIEHLEVEREVATFESVEQALAAAVRSEEHTSELQSQSNLVCRLLLEKKKKQQKSNYKPGRRLMTAQVCAIAT